MSPSFLLRALALTSAFCAPILVISCQEVPLFPIPEDGGDTTGTGGTTTSSTSTTGTGGNATTTTTTTGTGGHGGMATGSGGSSTGTGGSGGGTGTGGSAAGTGGAGTGGSAAGTGGAGGMMAIDAGADAMGTGGAASGTGGAGGVLDDGGASDAPVDDGSAQDAGMPDALDDGSMVLEAGDDAGACVSNKLSFPLEPGLHVASCTPIAWSSNPPTSGQHYPVWAAFKTYAAPVPRGFLVHALEHGAVVFTYNCPDGCAADIAALQAMLDARAADPLCVAPLKNRFIISPDPLLDSRFAASAWGFALKAECMDLGGISTFIDLHYAQAPENFCFDGTDVLAPAFGLPPDCGQPPIADAGTD
jgi:hypothetical protein